MKKNLILTHIVSAVLFLAVGFYVGTKYQQSQKPSFDRAGGRGQFTQNGNRGGGQTVGEIIGNDGGSITVKLQDGSSKIVLLGSNTSVIKSISATSAELTIGTKVGIFGQSNADGSITAQNIQLNPQGRNATPSAVTK